MRIGTAVRWMLRESRGARGRLVFLTGCLAVGVAAVVGTSALAAAVDASYRERSREILGADLTVDARRPLPRELGDVVAAFPGSERTDVLETASMVRLDRDGEPRPRSRIAQVHAVTGRFPLYGEVTTDPPGGLPVHLTADTAVLPRDLLAEIGAKVGDDVAIGGATFRVAAAVTKEPPSFGFSSFLGSRLYLSDAGLKRTQLLGFGTRATWRTYLALPPGSGPDELKRMTARIEALPGAAYLDVDAHTEVGPGQGRTAERLAGFLGLTSLLSLVVGGIGVAQIVRTWVASRTQSVAVLRCLGVRPAEILAISLGNLAVLSLAGSVVGAALGLALPAVADAFVPNLVPGGLATVFPATAVLRGIGLGVGVSLAFGLPPLTAIWRVPPARVLRADAAPLPAPRSVVVLSGALLAAGVVGAALVQSPRTEWAFAFAGGFGALVLVLWLAARGLVAAVRRLPRRRIQRDVAYALAALARPGAGTGGAIVALGLGTMVVAATWIVQSRFREALVAQVPPTAPSVFLVDVQPAQLDGVRTALRGAAAEHVDSVPVVMARIAEIDGTDVERISGEDGRLSRRLTREQRLTSRTALPADNQVVAGALWSDPSRAEVSVEQRFAAELGLKIGSVVRFDVQGVPLDVTVTSLRRVEWQSLSINFFWIVEPGVLDAAPALHLMSARVPAAGDESLQETLARAFPNVTVLRLGPVLEQVSALVGRVAAGVGALGAFSAAAGVLVLAGAASAAALRRRGEVALLKVLGVTRGGVVLLFALEFGAAGALAGLIGASGAVVLAGGFLAYVADVDLGPPLVAVPVAALLAGLATAACGLAASASALRTPPIETLRRRGG